jgi:hypothetical protein
LSCSARSLEGPKWWVQAATFQRIVGGIAAPSVPSLVTRSVFNFAQNQLVFGSTVRRCGAQRGAREMANLRTTAQTEEHFRRVFNREMTPEERRIVFIMLDDEPYPSSCWRQHSPQHPQRGRRSFTPRSALRFL